MVDDTLRETVTFACEDCDDFELTKSYSGQAGTPGKEEYDRIEAPDECPVCSGSINRSLAPDSEQEGSDVQ